MGQTVKIIEYDVDTMSSCLQLRRRVKIGGFSGLYKNADFSHLINNAVNNFNIGISCKLN